MQLERISGAIVRHGFTGALIVGSLAILSVGLTLMWRHDGPAVKRSMLPPVPKILIRSRVALRKARYTRKRRDLVNQLIDDAKAFRAQFEPKLFSAPFPYFVTKVERKLPARGGRIETAEVRIQTSIERLPTSIAGAFTKRRNIVLTVENRTDSFIAFRVRTSSSTKVDCGTKAVLRNSGMVLKPREAQRRVECMAEGRKDHVTVHRIDVLQIPALSYHYLIKVKPVSIGMNKRTSTGHTAPRTHALCATIPRHRIDRGQAQWVDVVDFYARFNCDRYVVPQGFVREGKAVERPLVTPKRL